ncbi:hypothetical protein [Marinigracilibium pacificum]|uniref:Uncharacterized protein n=1 Tax=Marinigracilibium pacificum TaxID=2729599 RepID=A0A848J6N0_9BACT|nr:hypothetical protein [Marinigracilibium pacificum]NMM50170.1 hypothetical protein [Marinigracilibium pacificum]
MRILPLIISFLFAYSILGQTKEDICFQVRIFQNDTVKVSADNLISGSLYVLSASKDYYTFTSDTSFIWQSESSLISVCYQKENAAYQDLYKYSAATYDSNALFRPAPLIVENQKSNLTFENSRLQTSGVLSRAVNTGTNNDAGIQSELLLNLNGNLSDDIRVNARISDRNVPYQPEGNTAQLQDFDKVFINVFTDRYSIEAGDIQFKNSSDYFLRYQKNVQGIGLKVKPKDTLGTYVELKGGINKGKFTTVYINPIEGVSGPYRLSEGINELYPVVIANSERVFLDGRLLQRGFDNDYIIDYNTAEITFSPDILITEFSRIRVDLEYAVLSYPRSTFNSKVEHRFKKGSISVEYYNEQDNYKKPLRFSNSSEIIDQLIEAGDTSQAVIPGYSIFEGDASQTLENLYIRKDSLIDGLNYQYFEIYTNSQDADTLYKVNFEYLGLGEGSYSRRQLNGQAIYVWEGNENAGEYDPVSIVPLPNKNSMVSLSGKLDITKNETLIINSALNIHESNRYYSKANNQSIKGYANNIQVLSNRRVSGFELKQHLSVDIIGENFQGIDRFRNMEFDRDWGQLRDTLSQENLISYRVGFSSSKSNYSYQIKHRDKENILNGTDHQFTIYQQLGKWAINGLFNRMEGSYYGNQNSWGKEYFSIEKNKGRWQPGYKFSSERNILKNDNDDFVIRSLQYFNNHDLYLNFNDSSGSNFQTGLFYREDKSPVNGSMLDYSKSINGYLKGNLSFLGDHRLRGAVILRSIDYAFEKEDETYAQGRIGLSGAIQRIGLNYNVDWNLQSSRELRRNFTFIEVPLGQGTHTWIDENNNGIKELGEFFEAYNPDERKYAKVFTPGNDYLDAFLSRLSFNYRWSMAGITKSRILNGFSFNGNLLYEQKTQASSFSERVNPFKELDNSVIFSNVINNYIFKWQSMNQGWYVQYGHRIRSRRQLLFSGFDTYRNTRSKVLLNVPIGDEWQSELGFISEFNYNEAENLTQKNFKIQQYIVNPALSWLPSNKFKAKIEYRIKSKDDLNSDVQSNATWQEGVISITGNSNNNFVATLNLEYKNINYDGEVNSASGYQMLEGFRSGNNFLWSSSLRKEIIKGLVLNLYYQGRKPSGTRVFHFASLQGSILF